MLAVVESKIDKNAKIIVACSTGGTMRPSQSLPEGQQSRSYHFSDSDINSRCFNSPLLWKWHHANRIIEEGRAESL